MQQIVSFKITFLNPKKPMLDLVKAVFLSQSPVVPSSNRFEKWINTITSRTANNGQEIVETFGEEVMLTMSDYECLFPQLFDKIASEATGVDFTAHAEFYTDDEGTICECDVEHKGDAVSITEEEYEDPLDYSDDDNVVWAEGLLSFWKFAMENFDGDSLIEAAEDNGVETDSLDMETLTEWESCDIADVMRDVINSVMDVSGIDNYGDIYEMLKAQTKLNEKQISSLLQ